MTAQPVFRTLAAASLFLTGCGLVNVNGKSVGSPPTGEASAGSTNTSAGGDGDGDRGGGGGGGGGDPHDRLSILELKIGMSIQQPGFVCAKDVGPYNGAECVKFLDRRCSGKPSNIGPKRYGEHAPRGCFVESSAVATYLDDSLMQQRQEVSQGSEKVDPDRYPLVNIHTFGTKAKPSRIHRIVYTMAVDELASGDKASGSKLYNALVAKYGQPKEIWSGKVKWRAGDTRMEAYCDLGMCTLEVQDTKFEENENRRQEEIDTKGRQNNAPTPEL
jgi:hypothetical protein